MPEADPAKPLAIQETVQTGVAEVSPVAESRAVIALVEVETVKALFEPVAENRQATDALELAIQRHLRAPVDGPIEAMLHQAEAMQLEERSARLRRKRHEAMARFESLFLSIARQVAQQRGVGALVRVDQNAGRPPLHPGQDDGAAVVDLSRDIAAAMNAALAQLPGHSPAAQGAVDMRPEAGGSLVLGVVRYDAVLRAHPMGRKLLSKIARSEELHAITQQLHVQYAYEEPALDWVRARDLRQLIDSAERELALISIEVAAADKAHDHIRRYLDEAAAEVTASEPNCVLVYDDQVLYHAQAVVPRDFTDDVAGHLQQLSSVVP